MDFNLSEEQKALKQLARNFAEKEIFPHISSWEKEGIFPAHVFKKMGSTGFNGMLIPEKYGGSDLGRLTTAMVLEELSLKGMGVSGPLAVHNMVAGLLAQYGSHEQCNKYLPAMARGEKLGAFALTESNAGSDASSLETGFKEEGENYIIHGNKIFITSGDVADIYVVMARNEEGISSFIVETGNPGLTFGKKEEKMGFNSSPTCEVSFSDCRVPKENLLGELGKGLNYAMQALDGGRINTGIISIGLARGALIESVKYAKERKQFGKPIANFQAIQFMLADMAMLIHQARLLVHEAAFKMDKGKFCTLEAAMAKCAATDAAMRVTTDAVQIFGGYGYMKEYPVERLMREAKVGQIVEGTNQIQRLVIARELLK